MPKSGRRVALVVRQSSNRFGNGFTSRLGFVHLDVPAVPSRISLLGTTEVAGGTREHDAEVWAPWIPFHAQAHRPLKRWRWLTLTQPSSSSAERAANGPFVLIGLSAYLRPSEGLGLRRGDVERPAANISKFWTTTVCPEEMVARAKVGATDDTLQLDSPFLQPWIGRGLTQLSRGEPNQPVFAVNYPNLLREINAEGRLIGLTEEALGQSEWGGVQPYQVRHSGRPSHEQSFPDSNRDTKERTMGIFEKSRKVRTRGSPGGGVANIHSTNGGLHRTAAPRLKDALWAPLAVPHPFNRDLDCPPNSLQACGGVAVPGVSVPLSTATQRTKSSSPLAVQ